jgi:hypothetical protein
MSLSLHEASIAVMTRMLRNLSLLLEKGAAHAAAKGIDPASLIEAKLAPDMLPFNRQVQIATDGAKGCASRLAGVEAPSWPDTETTFPELQARVAKAVAYLEGFGPDKIDGAEDKPVVVKLGPERVLNFTGRTFVLTFALPNFFFHYTTAYALLRAGGVEVGKRDYLGGI